MAGATIAVIAKDFDCCRETVRRRLKGILRKPGPPGHDTRSMLQRRHSENLPISELARQEGIDRSYLYRLIRTEYGGIDNWFKGA